MVQWIMNKKIKKANVLSTLSLFGIGMKRQSVDIQTYHPNWKEAFSFVKEQIKSILPKDIFCQIEHVGSTSIPGLSAKPILDILLIVHDASDLKKLIPILEAFGFAYKGDGVSLVHGTVADPERHTFSFYNDEETVDFIHAHMTRQNHVHGKSLLFFRDRLRASQKLAEEYQALKVKLWQDGIVRREYTRSKSSFIEKIISF